MIKVEKKSHLRGNMWKIYWRKKVTYILFKEISLKSEEKKQWKDAKQKKKTE